jgi:hypothetical protein
VREAICGLANSQGGYVIVGAVRAKTTKKWSLPGVVFPGEPVTWLDDVAESLRPRPRTELKMWELEGDRAAAVVQVEPVATPPCMTAGGLISERTSGKTVRVTDPLVLAGLYQRGEAAREASRSGAWNSLEVAMGYEPLRSDLSLRMILAMRARAYDSDISSRLFRRSTTSGIGEIARARLKSDRYEKVSAANEFWGQDRFGVRTVRTNPSPEYTPPARAWAIVVLWDGSVSIRCEACDLVLGVGLLFEDIVVPAWQAAIDLVGLMGGHGGAHVVIDFTSGGIRLDPGDEYRGGSVELRGSRTMARETPIEPPADELKESMHRELLRSLTFPAAEPEPQPEAS